jgi:pentatricopeptide repeat protein
VRRRSCGGGLLREMRERGGVDPDKYTYATVISGWCKFGRIEDASSLAREMHEGRRAGRRGGKVKAATGCDELGGATHGELPSSIQRSRQKQRGAGLTRSARPAAVVDRS